MPSGGVYEVHAVTTVFLPGKGFLESSKHDWMDCMKNYIVLSTPQRRVAKTSGEVWPRPVVRPRWCGQDQW